MSTIEANTLKPISGSSTLTLGESGDTVTLASGASSSGFGASLTGSTNNTVVTVTGANAMQGEANVTYADPKLMVANSGDSTFEIQSGNSNSCRLNFGDTDSSTIGQIRYRHDLNKMIVEVNGGSRLEIDNSGNVDIPTGNLTVSDSGSIGNGQGEYMQTNNVSDYLAFFTGSSERVRINDQGSFMVGATSTIGTQGILLKNSDYTATYRTTSDGGHYIHSFHSNVGGTASAKYAIYANGTASTPSDENYKKNITDARNYLEDLEKIKVIKYNWKTDDDSTPKELGFSAQQVETVFAGMVDDDTTPLKNLYEEGDTIPEGKKIGDVKSETPRTQKLLKKEVFIPMLVKSVQELSEKNKTLETKIEALEAKVAALESA